MLAKSVPVKKYDIKTGEAIMTARQKCPGLVAIPPDYGLYVSASRAFIEKLRQYTDQVSSTVLMKHGLYLTDMKYCTGKGRW